jgi:lipoyl(octanoyl) transferase
LNDVLTAFHLGPTPYREGLAIQDALVRLRADEAGSGADGTDWLLFPDHPPVLTMGRSGSGLSLRADPTALERLGIELIQVTRGGDVTWHGPGQLVGYPIVDLDRRGRDLHRFLRDLEEALIQVLAGWGIASHRVKTRTGVWVGEEKIASLGIAVRRWVSYHGFALNVAPDLGFFELIHPCGLRGIHMTSAAARLGQGAPSLERARREVAVQVGLQLGYREVRWAPADEVRRLAAGAADAPARVPLEDHAA